MGRQSAAAAAFRTRDFRLVFVLSRDGSGLLPFHSPASFLLLIDGTPSQRFFNLLHGVRQRPEPDVVEKGFLPEDRAVGCKREYAQVSRAFATLIGPHVDTKLARRLHKRWLPPVTTKPQPWQGRTD